MLLAVDLAGAVHGLGLCEESPGQGCDTLGWLVRSRLLQAHWWMSDASPGDDRSRELTDMILAARERWGVALEQVTLVDLGSPGAKAGDRRAVCDRDWLSVAGSLGVAGVCFPSTTHVISPRGIAPAAAVKDYAHAFERPRRLDLQELRDAYVSLMERAAEDVQADGFEQDDSFLDRFAEIGFGEEPHRLLVPVEVVTQADWLTDSWHQAWTHWHGLAAGSRTVEIERLQLRCVVETAETFRAPPAATDGRLDRARLGPASGASEQRLDRSKLLAGDQGSGPVAVADGGRQVRIPTGWRWAVNPMGHLVCQPQCCMPQRWGSES